MSDRLRANRFTSARATRPVAALTRRVVMVAVLTVMGGLALGACRSDPSVAAYIGDQVITVDQVRAFVTDLDEKMKAAAANQPADSRPAVKLTETEVLLQLVVGRACAVAQAKEGFKGNPISAEQVAQQQGIPASSLFAQERAKTETCLSGINLAAAGAPTEEDVRDIYDRADAHFEVTAAFDEIKSQLVADPDIRTAVGAKRAVLKMIKDANVEINPQYRPLEFTLSDLGNQEQVPLVVAVLSPGSDAVRDVS